MKPEDLKGLDKKTGVSRVWIAVAAAAGAAIAYLGDPERGIARRAAALGQLSGVTRAASGRANRWRELVSARLSRRAQAQLPSQVTIPHDSGRFEDTRSQSTSAAQPAETSPESKKPRDVTQ